MSSSKFPPTFERISFLAFAVLLTIGTAFATTEKVVYSFQGTPDGYQPSATLVADSVGNLYGTTTNGGFGQGTVFELSPPATAGGTWTEQILHSFQNDSHDGMFPMGTLTFDKEGNLYGTTPGGGPNGLGTIFELSPPATSGGAWTEFILWSSPGGASGYYPSGKLDIDAAGNLYGTTPVGGAKVLACSCGIVFELVKPKTSGQTWKERILHNFAAANDGIFPSPDLLFRGGMLYGTTQSGGTKNFGTVFQLAPHTGLWTETILHSFTNSEGIDPAPMGGLIADAAGNLFGTLSAGGTADCSCGTVFRLSPPATSGGVWQETTLYSFTGHSDGARPLGTLWHDSLDNLFGTTTVRGRSQHGGEGTVFKLKAPAVSGGAWTFVLLHDFGSLSNDDGGGPTGGLILQNGLFYGTTVAGGVDGKGTVFSLVP